MRSSREVKSSTVLKSPKRTVLKESHGLSIIEFIIYFAIVAVVVTITTQLIAQMLRVSERNRIIQEVQDNMRLVSERYSKIVRASKSICQPAVGPGVQGYWRLDEGSGTSAFDSSGNSNTGTLTEGPTWVDGKINKALNFDGTNDYVNVADSATLEGMANLTVSAWFKANVDAVAFHYILTKQNSSVNNLGGYEILLSSGNVRTLLDIGGTVKDISSSGTDYRDGTWHYAAATYDGSTMRLFVDGTEKNSVAATGGIGTSTIPLTIGIRNDLTLPFSGLIDDVRIYNRALSATEVAEMADLTQTKLRDNAVCADAANETIFKSVLVTDHTEFQICDDRPVGTCAGNFVPLTSDRVDVKSLVFDVVNNVLTMHITIAYKNPNNNAILSYTLSSDVTAGLQQ